MLRAENSMEHQMTIFGPVFLYERAGFRTKNSKYFCHNDWPSIYSCEQAWCANKLHNGLSIKLSGFKHFYSILIMKKAAVIFNFCLIGNTCHNFLVPRMIEQPPLTFISIQTPNLLKVITKTKCWCNENLCLLNRFRIPPKKFVSVKVLQLEAGTREGG